MTRGSDDQQEDTSSPDLVCLTHLRWNWVFQRPQHLMTRAAQRRRVFVIEEPVRSGSEIALEITTPARNLCVIAPRIPKCMDGEALKAAQRTLVDLLLRQHGVSKYTLWYYTPMALPFTRHLSPLSVVYDCMDELSAFAGAPPELTALEAELLTRCDLVLTGGHSLYEAKRERHHNVHAYPSAVDVGHFAAARTWTRTPDDQRKIPAPRIGYYGVIDERLDLPLISGLARNRPDWQIVLIGPIIKVDPANLPQAPNIHYWVRSVTKNCRRMWRDGMWLSCHLRETRQPVLSVRQRHRNIWPPENRWYRRPFGMLSVPMAQPEWFASRILSTHSCRRWKTRCGTIVPRASRASMNI
jgi:hypothetical protein